MRHLDLDPETWAELSRLLDSALDLPRAQRARWLDELDPRHQALRPRLQELLARAADVETRDFLDALPRVDDPDPAPSASANGERVGAYRLLRELGHGGMGAVWLAQRADGLFQRPVALKFPRGAWIREGLRERMAREREILAALEHPGIARLYDAGVTERGEPYLALEYVEGRTLDAYVAERRPDLLERLELFLQVADAMAYAHSKLIIHRDLKPSNVLVTAQSQARLLDFGIGKLLDEHQARFQGLTEAAGRALTPEYASPEQIAGQPLGVGTDVYSLGVMLYELLTGQRPYRLKRQSLGALEEAIIGVDPRPPSQVVGAVSSRKALRGDLDAIVLKALKKTTEERYPTVAALAEDVRRYLAGRPVEARPDHAGYRLRKFLQRHKLGAATACVAALALIGGAAVALWQARIAGAEAKRAEDVAQFVSSIFRGIDPALLGTARPLTATEVLDQARQRVVTELADDPELQLRLRAVIARSYLGLYEQERARALLDTALAQAHDVPEAAAAVLPRLHLLMAEVMLGLADHATAQAHLARAMADYREGDPGYVEARLIESELAYARGRYDRAAQLARVALDAAEPIAGLDPAVRLNAYTAMGKAAGMQRDVAASLQYNRQALDLALRTFGNDPGHPEVLETEQNYAASLIDSGRLADATPHLERSLQGARRTYGDDSLLAGQYAVRLGLVLMETGHLGQAIELIAEGLRIEASFELGPLPSRAGRQRTLARAYLAARRMPDAARQIDEAVATMAPADLPFMMRVLEADQAFAHAAASGELAEAIARLESIVAAQDQDDPRYKTHLPDAYLGMLHLWRGAVGAALLHLEQGVRLARAQTRLSDLGEALVWLGAARIAAGDVAGARRAVEEGLERLRDVQTAATPAQAEGLLTLGRVALLEGAPAVARGHLREAAEFWAAFDPHNRGAGEVQFWLGRAESALRAPAAAAEAFAAGVRLLAGSPLPADAGLLQQVPVQAGGANPNPPRP